jgi:hypothetical protein
MTNRSDLASSFTTSERELIRREMGQRFGSVPCLADGIWLRTWRTGERKGQPKIPPALQTMMERGLLEIRKAPRGFHAFFTEAGIAELRLLFCDRRAMDPIRFAHLRRELAVDAAEEKLAAE